MRLIAGGGDLNGDDVILPTWPRIPTGMGVEQDHVGGVRQERRDVDPSRIGQGPGEAPDAIRLLE